MDPILISTTKSTMAETNPSSPPITTNTFQIRFNLSALYKCSVQCSDLMSPRMHYHEDTLSRPFLFPQPSLTSDEGAPQSPSWALLSPIFADSSVILNPLENLHWAGPDSQMTQLENVDAAIRRIVDVARSEAAPETGDAVVVPLLVAILRVVRLPRAELDALLDAKMEENRQREELREREGSFRSIPVMDTTSSGDLTCSAAGKP